ncbi:tetratricopeptide repeat protein [sulfur-oxidizing endosymbiont of Gigantopelta aegis]|uniref:tetratricopeptide repeat protein n=1 Tax=sulfur-oxidizing endosymbiont of Gigantopelta aegis TaxID=2794934 RepID=UPI0018DD7996|nr:tetratricopeptide repeat protein [sulfur-oxidizing endosymbiont of Gigantopelta aegis]
MVAIYSSNKQYKKAIALLKDYHSKNPDMLGLPYLTAEVHVLNGDKKEALTILERLIKEKPEFIPPYQLASRIAKTNDPRQSEKYFKQAVDNNPSQDQVWITLANFYFNLDSLKKAEQTLREGVKLNPNSITLKFELAATLQEQGKLKEANKNYRLILVKDPSHYAALHNLLSNLALDKNGYKEALSIGKIMFDRGITEPSILGAYGNVLLRSGNFPQATLVLEKAIKSITDNYIVTEPKESANIFLLAGQAYLKTNKMAKLNKPLNEPLN